MKKLGISSLCLFFMVVGCGTPSRHWEDQRYAVAMDTGKSVFERGYMGQAALQYKSALERALAANDTQGIHDAGYNLATVQLRQGEVDECSQTLDRVFEALKIREWNHIDDLVLIRSFALYDQGLWKESEEKVRRILSSQSQGVPEQAYTLLGLNAAQQKNKDVLQQAMKEVQKYKSSFAQDNMLELQTHQFLLNNLWSEACRTAEELAQRRQQANDYRAMRRALKLKVQAYQGQGNQEKANMVEKQIKDSFKNR